MSAPYGTCPVCLRVLGTVKHGWMRYHDRDVRWGPDMKGTVRCTGSHERYAEYEQDQAEATASNGARR